MNTIIERAHQHSRRDLVLVMVSLILAILPIQMDALVTATAVPTIVGDLGGFSRIAWVATVYLLTMAIGTIVSGRFGDMFGRKKLHLVAMSVFLAGSAWAGLSTDMTEFIVARAIQGLGAGMAFTTILAIVADVVPAESRARYQGLLATVAPVSMIAGPTVGGLITDHWGWRWIFLCNLPLIAVSLVVAVAALHLPRHGPGGDEARSVDVSGVVWTSLGAGGVVLAATWAGQHGWGSPSVLAAAVIGLIAFAVLVRVERRAANPVLPMGLFTNRTVLMCLVIMFCGAGAVMMAATNFVPVFQQLVQHQSASSSGLLLLPLLLPTLAMAALSGQYVSKTGRFRAVLIAGTATLTAGCGLLATMGPSTSVWITGGYLAVSGLGLGMLFQTPLVLVQNSAPPDQVGAATGTTSFLRMLGGALGVGALGTLFISSAQSALADAAVSGLDAHTLAALTPDQLAGMTPSASAALADAVASGVSVLFWAALALGAVALLAAIAIPRRDRYAQQV